MLKKILHFILFLLATNLAFGQTTTVLADWDGTDLTINGSFGNGHFGDSTFAIVANPNASGINTSANVQNWQKANDAQTWGGFFYDPPEAIDLTGGVGEICISAYSDHEFNLRAKIEKSDDGGPNASFDMTYNTPGEWQQLCYNLMGPDVNGDTNTGGFTYTRLTLFPDFGTVPAADASYYFDDISKTTGGMAPPPSKVIADWDGTDLTINGSFGNGHFGDSTFAIVANPNPSGINTSDNVQNWQKADDAQTWGGFFYDPPEAIDLRGAFGQICISAYSDHEFNLRAKIEKSEDGGVSSSYDMTYNTPGEWQQLCYDMLGPNVNGDADAAGFTYTRLTLFPDFGTVPATDASYYIDDIIKITDGLGGGIPDGANLISDYEPDGVTVEMVSSFGNGHYGSDLFDVVANPSPDATNPTSMVQEWCKADDAQTWGGWTLGEIDSLDFTGTIAKVCFSVLSDSESLIRLKLEGSPTAGFDARIDEDYTTPGEWQTLCFDFSQPDVNGNLALGHQFFQIVFFPDFGTVPAADKCFYIDNIYEENDGTGMVPVFISDLIKDSPDHNTLEDLMNAADLWGRADADGVTVFAPTDAAFAALPASEMDALTNNTDNKLYDFLLHHIILAEVPTADLAMDNVYLAGNGQDATVTAGNAAVDGATISQGDIAASNGILHMTSEVMTLPQNPQDGYLFMDNETDETTLEWAWTPVTIVPNPAPGGINTSATVANFIKTPGGPWWQGSLTELKRVVNFREGIQNVCVDMLADHPATVKFKMENPLTPLPEAGGAPATYISFSSNESVANEWTQICADIAVGTFEDGAGDTHDLEGPTHIFAKPVFFIDFIDAPLPADTVNYFLDNFITKTMTVGTNDLDRLENFTMYPNPTAETITIETDTPVSRAIIFDASGIRVMDINDPIGKAINVAKLPTGLYFMGMQGEDGNYIGTSKFMKK
ncbi:MAG TPA: T9SS type A sorting domain-containing protein [Bacteroidetes bacterium]|nr:T9SS type A sorting domain-containing protein [Bacteroidota bacterium]